MKKQKNRAQKAPLKGQTSGGYISQKIWFLPKHKKIMVAHAHKDACSESAVMRAALEFYHLNVPIK